MPRWTAGCATSPPTRFSDIVTMAVSSTSG
jgi:hypothetical protein